MDEDDSWMMEGAKPEYSYSFSFETYYSYVDTQKWLRNNFVYCYGCIILYIVVNIFLKSHMLDKPKYNLKHPLTLWNGLMTLFSIIGFSRTAPELFFALRDHSLFYSVCIPSNYFQNSVFVFWTWALILLKFVQLCDTTFLLLKKEKITFLHVYRHLSIIPYIWFTYMDTTAAMRWFSVMEYFLQFCLYFYYIFKAMEFRIPIYFAMVINTIQIIQVVIGYLITLMAYNQQAIYKIECHITHLNIVMGLTYYLTCFCIYMRFMCTFYFLKKLENNAEKID